MPSDPPVSRAPDAPDAPAPDPAPDPSPARPPAGPPAGSADRAAAPVLEVTGLTKRFGGLVAVDAMDLAVAPGEIVGLIGPNGAGKTTLFNVVAGAMRPDRGRVTFAGQDVTGAPAHRMARAGLARTFQITRALGRLTVLENTMLAGPDQRGERLAWALLGGWRAGEDALRQRALDVLGQVGLAGEAGAYAGSLSGGQRKLLELARALLLRPRLMLLDEPMAGVNPALAERLMAEVRRLRRDQGLAFLIVEHDVQAILANCDRVVVMAEGRKLMEGTPAEVRADPRVLEAYLGAVT